MGIGTSSPQSLLDVYNYASGTGSADLRVAGGYGGNASLTLATLSAPQTGGEKVALVAEGISSYGRANLHFVVNSGADHNDYVVGTDTKMIIKYYGNVGIGTTSPDNKAHIAQDLNWTTLSQGQLKISGTTDENQALWIGYDNTDNYGFIDVGDVGTAYQNLALCQGGGKVGIGTTSPVARLDIVEDGANPGLRLNHGGNNLYATIQGPENRDLRFDLRDNYWDDKFTFRNAAENNLMFIRRDGVVSIGTVSIPQGFAYKLAVDGKIICEEVKVKDSGSWPDHVFQAGYDLMPLPDVERYIAEHQHLPDVPSAEEVAADGLSLGETQAILLQKIEELTLYVIELDKENRALKERVAHLEQ